MNNNELSDMLQVYVQCNRNRKKSSESIVIVFLSIPDFYLQKLASEFQK
jgi:hypothetical protein